MAFDLKFRNEYQKEFFFLNKRNKCFSGGYGNGKTYVACQIAMLLLLLFPGYRVVIARRKASDLRKTTMKTFFKVCTPDYIASHNKLEGLTVLKNGSEVVWIHLDEVDEYTLRGLEINTVVIDQGEEIEESVYLTLDARIGRWDQAVVPDVLPFGMRKEDFPTNIDGRPIPPSYMIVLCNPDAETHWIWRRYHPDSVEWQVHYAQTHGYVEAPTDPNSYGADTYEQMKSRDPEWVRRFMEGKWGISEAAIHYIRPESILHVNKEWLNNLKKKSVLVRALDHGESAPTTCLWSAFTPEKQIVFYREYYMPNQQISYHRQMIQDLSIGEHYQHNIADPSIFKKAAQREGAVWSISSEYLDKNYDADPIAWAPADNNELGTRNRINELLLLSPRFKHPLTGESPAPGIYFVQRDDNVPDGCVNAIAETKAQRRDIIGSLNGKTLYSDERTKKVADHAYDGVRYTVALHLNPSFGQKRSYPPGSMGAYKELHRRFKQEGYLENYGYED